MGRINGNAVHYNLSVSGRTPAPVMDFTPDNGMFGNGDFEKYFKKRERANARHMEYVQKELADLKASLARLEDAVKVLGTRESLLHRQAFQVFPLETVEDVMAYPDSDPDMTVLIAR